MESFILYLIVYSLIYLTLFSLCCHTHMGHGTALHSNLQDNASWCCYWDQVTGDIAYPVFSFSIFILEFPSVMILCCIFTLTSIIHLRSIQHTQFVSCLLLVYCKIFLIQLVSKISWISLPLHFMSWIINPYCFIDGMIERFACWVLEIVKLQWGY